MAAWAVSRLARGGLVELSITAPGRGARLLRSELPPPPEPRPLAGREIPCPEGSGAAPGGGSRTRAKSGCATAAGLRATAFSAQAGLPLRRGGNLEMRCRLEAPAPRFFVLAQSSAVSRLLPASSGSPRRALLGCSGSPESQFPLPPAHRRLPRPAGSPKPSASRTAEPASTRISKLRFWYGEGGARDEGPLVSAFSPRPSSATTLRAAPRPQRSLFAP